MLRNLTLLSLLVFSTLCGEAPCDCPAKECAAQDCNDTCADLSNDNVNSKEESKDNSNSKDESKDNDNSKDESKDNSNSKEESKDNSNSKEESKDNSNSKEESKDNSNSKDEPKEKAPPKIGNYALPGSQMPTGLLTIGATIIDKGEVEFDLFADIYKGKQRVISDILGSILLGATDDFCLSFHFPCAPRFRDGCDKSSGFEDFIIQAEYAFFGRSTYCYTDQATIVAAVVAPTGNFDKTPPIGLGSPGIFIGATYYHTAINWLVFCNEGALFTTSHHRNQVGDQFLYQFGFGANLPSPRNTIFTWMIEFDGVYSRKNIVNGALDNNSGGNFLVLVPSLWFSTKHLKLQFGPSIPIDQHLFGVQRKIDWGFNFFIAWSFYDE